MQVVLVMFRADGERRSFSVTRDVTVIGRRVDCDLRIPLSDVSRKHCRFLRDGDTLHIEDLGSSNGTYHNGQRVQEAIIEPGDTIQVGPVVFCVQIDGVPAEEDMSPLLTTPAATYDSMSESAAAMQAAGMGVEAPAEELTEPAAADGLTFDDEPAVAGSMVGEPFEEEPVVVETPAEETPLGEEANSESPVPGAQADELTLDEDAAGELTLEDGATDELPLGGNAAGGLSLADDSASALSLDDDSADEVLLGELSLEEPAPAESATPDAPADRVAPVAPVALEPIAAEEEPLALEELPIKPAPAVNLVEEAEPLSDEEFLAGGDEQFSIEDNLEEGQVQEDLIEDFDIIDEESHGSQSGDMTVDSEQQ